MYRPFKNLRMRMVQLDYNQEELGKAAGIPKATLSQRINGKKPFDAYQISALCKVLENQAGGNREVFFRADGPEKGRVIH